MSDQWTDRLSEYLDDELSAAEVARLEAHLAGCAACVAVLRQLDAVRERGRALTDREPAVDLWPGIEERIRAATPRDVPVVPIDSGRRGWRRVSFTVPQLAAAAVALVAISGGSAWLASSARVVEVAVTDTDPAPATAIVDFATAEYDATVRELEAVLDEMGDELDPSTRRALERSLATIDRAVQDARTALARDPANVYVSTHLARSMKRKVEILRRALALANVTT